MRADEPATSPRDDRASALRSAIELACHGSEQAPSFSSDGGATVHDAWGRSARVQPLGQRTRISLTAEDGHDAEAEVDTDTLVAAIGRHRSAYGAVAAALEHENALGSSVE
jgi:hypothetical protein